jgi:hypothetical protein
LFLGKNTGESKRRARENKKGKEGRMYIVFAVRKKSWCRKPNAAIKVIDEIPSIWKISYVGRSIQFGSPKKEAEGRAGP